MKTNGILFWFLVIGFLIATFFGVKKLLVGSNEKFTREYDALFIKYAQKYGLDAKMLKAIALHESSLGQDKRVKNKQVSRDGKTFGIFQIKLSTAQYYIKGITLDDLINSPEKGIEAAAAYLADLKKKFKGDEKKIVISYNQGETNTLRGRDFTGDYYPVYLKNKELIG